MKSLQLVLFAVPILAFAYLPNDFNEDLSIVADQLKSFHGIQEAVVGSLKARGRTEEQILEILDYVMRHPDEFHPGSAGKASGCLRLLQSTNAFLMAETLLNSDSDSVRWQATLAYQNLAFSKQYPEFDSMQRFKSRINQPSKYRNEVLHWIYDGFSNELRFAGSTKTRQRKILVFLLEQTLSDTQNAPMLDEILCREIPKWRASPQRAENAAKMIRNHPDDAELVAFFQMVRTNAIESAKMTLSAKRTPADSPSSADSLLQTAAPSAETDPWAGLLDDLPEKKQWIPPPDAEPPL